MITIYTDGSARGNPGPGGWGAIVIGETDVTELGGREPHTTNNRMEMTATLEGLRFVNFTRQDLVKKDMVKNIKVHIKTDSQYVLKGMTEWIQGWQKRGWIGSNKKPVLNRDLWEALLEVSKGLNVTYEYVRGHVGIAGNERADEIATTYADNLELKLYRGSPERYHIKS
jgi:ribonuclease HI